MSADTAELVKNLRKHLDEFENTILRKEAPAAERPVHHRSAQEEDQEAASFHVPPSNVTGEPSSRYGKNTVGEGQRSAYSHVPPSNILPNNVRNAAKVKAKQLYQPYKKPVHSKKDAEQSCSKSKTKQKVKEASLEFKVNKIILLPRKNITESLNRKQMSEIAKHKLLCDVVDFSRQDSPQEVKRKLKARFPEYLENMDFDILKLEGTALITPNLAEGQVLNGENLAGVFVRQQKTAYLRPAEDLNVQLDESIFPVPHLDSDDDFFMEIEKPESQESHSQEEASLQKSPSNESADTAKNSVNEDAIILVNEDDAIDFQYDYGDDNGLLETFNLDPNSVANTSFKRKIDSFSLYDSDEEPEEISTAPLELTNAKDNTAPSEPMSNAGASSSAAPVDLKLVADKFFKKISEQLKGGIQAPIYVDRDHPLESNLIRLQSPGFDPRKNLFVIFTNQGVREDGVDNGGPRNENFRLVMEEVAKSSLFEGPVDKRFLAYDVSAYDERKYFYVGQITALSIAHRGPGPNCFDPEFSKAISTQTLSGRTLSIEHIWDADIRAEAEKFVKTSNLKELNHFLLFSPLSLLAVLPTSAKSMKEKPKILEALLKDLLIDRLEKAFKQFLEGLSTLSVLQSLAENEEICAHFFEPYPFPLSALDVQNIFELKRSKDQEQVKLENRSLMYWNYYLEYLEGEAQQKKQKEGIPSLEDVIVFCTGLKREPPFGWPNQRKPSLQFLTVAESTPYVETADDLADRCFLPEANTCEPWLKLPILNGSFDSFKVSMNLALNWCKTMENR